MLGKLGKIPAKLKLAYRCIRGPYFRWVSPGHYYSPLPDMSELARREAQIFGAQPREFAGIDLHAEEQVRLLTAFAPYYSHRPFDRAQNPKSRYFWPNQSFPFQDAFVLYAFLRHFQPSHVVEVGSGLSTCATLDTCEDLGLKMRLTLIDPYPDWVNRFVRPQDSSRYSLRQQFIQDVPLDLFASLGPRDILFIDTSHVSKVGSDVNHIFFQILPVLKPGVIVHFHDIWYPFEYPKDWLNRGIFWNEAYLLRAFLMFNPSFRVLLFNNYLNHCSADLVKSTFPLFLQDQDQGLSLWLQRV